MENGSDVNACLCANGPNVWSADEGNGIAGTGASIVRLRRRREMRRIPLLIFSYEDLRDDVDAMDKETDAIEAVVMDDGAVGCLSSLEQSDVGWVD